MLKRLRAAHPLLYCILAEVLFLGSLFLSSLVLTVALVAAGADFSGLDEYRSAGRRTEFHDAG